VYELISSNQLSERICGAYGIDPNTVSGISITLDAGELPIITVYLIADERLLDVNWGMPKERGASGQSGT
jgi:hypothetical protein